MTPTGTSAPDQPGGTGPLPSGQNGVCASPQHPDELVLLAHDLRAALADVTGGLGLIDGQTAPASMRAQLDRVRAAADGLARLTEEALALMTSCRPTASDGGPQTVHMPEFLSGLAMRWSGRALEQRLGFEVHRAPGTPRQFTADRLALERVLSNLLGNAVHYSDQGTIRLEVSPDTQGRLRFSVIDEGPGLTAAALEFLFKPQPETRRHDRPGSGMGLHIASELATRIGAELCVKNLPERGVRADLWLSATDQNAPADTAGGTASQNLRGLKILVVDDAQVQQMVLGEILEAEGVEVWPCADAESALVLLGTRQPDLAIIDTELPGLSGLDLIRRLRGNAPPGLSRLPVLAFTAHADAEVHAVLRAAGAGAVLRKPLRNPGNLSAALRALLAAPPSTGPDSVPFVVPPLPGLDVAVFDHLLDLAGPDIAAQLLDRLALDLQQTADDIAAAGADWARLRKASHNLISLAGTAGAASLSAAAQALNDLARAQETAAVARSLPGLLADLHDLIGYIRQRGLARHVAG